MANAHRNTVLLDEREVARLERQRKRDRDQERKLHALQRKFDRRSGREAD